MDDPRAGVKTAPASETRLPGLPVPSGGPIFLSWRMTAALDLVHLMGRSKSGTSGLRQRFRWTHLADIKVSATLKNKSGRVLRLALRWSIANKMLAA